MTTILLQQYVQVSLTYNILHMADMYYDTVHIEVIIN